MPISGPRVPSGILGHSFVEKVFAKIRENGKSICMINDAVNKEYTYGDILKQSVSIALKLQKLGVGENVVVASFIDNCFESLAFQVGIWFAQGISNPVNHFLKPDEVRECISVSQPTIILCSNKYLKLVEESTKNIGWKTTIVTTEKTQSYLCYKDFLNEDASNFKLHIKDPANHVLYALFTSGTTGVPKAVKLRDEALLITSNLMQWDGITRAMLTSPMFWISNNFLVGKCLLDKVTLILPAETDAEGLLKCITKYKPQGWFTGPAVLLEMCYVPNLHKYDTSSIKMLLFGGSRTSLEHKHLIRKKVFNDRNMLFPGYGSTEVGFIAYTQKEIPVDSPQYDTIGTLANGIEMKIVDVTTGKELGPGQDGEFCVKSKGISAGYMNKNLGKGDMDAEGWWHMGDIGHYDENGFIYFTSRMKEIMKYRGVQIAPAELEILLHKHPDVVEACVVGKPHEIDGEWPTAFIVKKPNSSLTEKELNQLVEESVADSKKLRGGIYFVSSFPRNAVGKILKKDLTKLLT